MIGKKYRIIVFYSPWARTDDNYIYFDLLLVRGRKSYLYLFYDYSRTTISRDGSRKKNYILKYNFFASRLDYLSWQQNNSFWIKKLLLSRLSLVTHRRILMFEVPTISRDSWGGNIKKWAISRLKLSNVFLRRNFQKK